MKMPGKALRAPRNPKDIRLIRKIYAILTLPIFLVQMTSFNLILLQPALAAEEPIISQEAPITPEKEEVKTIEDKTTSNETEEKTESKVSENEVATTEAEEKTEPVPTDPESTVKEAEPVADEPAKTTEDPIGTQPEVSTPETSAEEVLPISEAPATENPDEIIPEISPVPEGPAIDPVPAVIEKEVAAEAPIIASESTENSATTVEAPIETWRVEGDKAVTNANVVFGETYTAPQNDQVTVTFTKLPENPGTLSVEEINLTDEQMESLGALSRKAYDITSTMEDGTFEYALTLPKPKNQQNVQIKFAEDVAGLEKPEVVPNADVEVKSEELVASLDHFTIFVTANPTIAVNSGISGGTVSWTDLGNIYSLGGGYASAMLTGTGTSTHYLKSTNYNFNIPTGAIINGVTATVYRRDQVAGVNTYRDKSVKLIKGGVVSGNDLGKVTTDWPSIMSPTVYGGEMSLWGTTLTAEDVNSPDFGFAISVRKVTGNTGDILVYVDYMKLNVEYSAPSTTTLTSSSTPSTYGTPVTFTANVTGSDVVPVGTVTFKDGATSLGTVSLSGGTASLTISNLSSGSHNITATYNGGTYLGNYDASTSTILTQDVTPATLSVTANNQTKSYATPDPTFTFTYTGFVNGETAAVIDTPPTCTVIGAHDAPGTYPITCSGGVDNNYNFIYFAGTLTVADLTAPVIAPQADVTAFNDPGLATAVVNYAIPTAKDNVDPAVTVNCLPTPGSIFSIGTTPVTCSATDSALNTSSLTFNVIVSDNEAPIITLLGANPHVIEVGTAYSELGATANDNFLGDITSSIIINTTAVNTSLIGDYVVTYDVSDTNGNAATQVTRTVHVVDTTAPTITAPADVTVQASGINTSLAIGSAIVSDLVDPAPLVTNDAPATFPLGTTVVTWTATDFSGNSSVVTQNINVIDTTAPVITLLGSDPATIEVHTPYLDAGATAVDNYNGDLSASITIINPVNFDVVGDYIVTYDVSDTNGNAATQVTRTVHVVDTTAPVITLLGEIPWSHEEGTHYVEAGATWTDNVDGSGTVTNITSTVNDSEPGSYIVTYTVTDSSGNTATTTRTVIVRKAGNRDNGNDNNNERRNVTFLLSSFSTPVFAGSNTSFTGDNTDQNNGGTVAGEENNLEGPGIVLGEEKTDGSSNGTTFWWDIWNWYWLILLLILIGGYLLWRRRRRD